MLDGSGIGGVEKVPLAEIAPVPAGVWVKARANSDAKGPPVTPPCVPGVQFPSTEMLRKPGGPPRDMIEVLANVPKTLSPKVRLVGMVVLNATLPKDWLGMPAKTPSLTRFEIQLPSVKAVAVLMFPVSVVVGARATKPWCPVGSGSACRLVVGKIGSAWTPVVRNRQVTTADSPKRTTGRIANLR
jgi:hypothetical protein